MWFSFNETQGDMIVYGRERYFLAQDPKSKSRFLVSTRCRHRGGPLNMADYDEKKNCLTCPWHKVPTSIHAMRKRAIVSARTGDNWVAMLPDEEPATAPLVIPSLGRKRHGNSNSIVKN